MVIIVVVRAERAADEKAPGISIVSIGRVSVITVAIVGPRCIISPA